MLICVIVTGPLGRKKNGVEKGMKGNVPYFTPAARNRHLTNKPELRPTVFSFVIAI